MTDVYGYITDFIYVIIQRSAHTAFYSVYLFNMHGHSLYRQGNATKKADANDTEGDYIDNMLFFRFTKGQPRDVIFGLIDVAYTVHISLSSALTH